RRHLPASLRVVCLNFRHALTDELVPHFAATLVLLAELRAKRAIAELHRGAECLNGFQLFQSAARMHIFGDDSIHVLCIRTAGAYCKHGEHRQEEWSNLYEFRSGTGISHTLPQNRLSDSNWLDGRQKGLGPDLCHTDEAGPT